MLTNKEIKYYSSLQLKKYRDEEKKFLIEGPHLVEECLISSYKMECVIIRDDKSVQESDELLLSLKKKNIPFHYLKPSLFGRLQDTQNSQGMIGVVDQKKPPSLANFKSEDTLIALDRITDPGNLGTIIRTAYWFGIYGILIGVNSVNIYNSKVVRSSQGALFHIDILENLVLEEVIEDLQKSKFNVYLLSPQAESTVDSINRHDKNILVFGNESRGISRALLRQGYEKVKIKGFSACESLNVAVSCGIVLNSLKQSR